MVTAGSHDAVRGLLVRAERLARDGKLVDLELAAGEAIHLLGDDADGAMDELCRVYIEVLPVRWTEPYTFPDPAVVRFLEARGGTSRVAEALANAANRQERAGQPEEALRCLRAAANVEALLGAPNRLEVATELHRLAFRLGHLEEALAAASLVCNLVPDYPGYHTLVRARAQHDRGVTLLALARARDAVGAFEEALRAWDEFHPTKGGRKPMTTIEAEAWLERARIAAGDLVLDEALNRCRSDTERCLEAGENEGAIEALSRLALLALETGRPADALAAAERLAELVPEKAPPHTHLAVQKWLARSLLALGRREEAAENLRAAAVHALDAHGTGPGACSLMARYEFLLREVADGLTTEE
jgi:tetratricopeptide (TPR) repeat protein